MINVSIIGATGYTGGELLRYILKHPKVRVRSLTSQSQVGVPISNIHTDLKNRCDIVLEKNVVAKIAQDTDAVFLCLPHAESAATAAHYIRAGVKVIDLSADFRLKSPSVYKEWYGIKHPVTKLIQQAVYGLPEIYREKIKKAQLIANPGCYATTSILTTLPLVQSGWIDNTSIVIDAKSGVSGAGRKMDARYLFCESHENFSVYAVAQHRHMPEIEQILNDGNKKAKAQITFVPHLLPINRGILATVYAKFKRPVKSAKLHALFAAFYKDERFVKILPEGSFPEVKSVQNTNYCQIGVRADERNRRAVIVGVLDNLGKGASGQALQNLNLMFGLHEAAGLE